MNDDEITSEHTSARMAQVLAEVEDLRLEMGRNLDPRRPMLVREASPREVYYHARTMFSKANQLCVELGAEPARLPDVPSTADAHAADVLRVIDATRERLARARAELHLDGDAPPELPGPLTKAAGKGPSDVLSACLIAGRQLNVMLARAVTSREAFERLMGALGLASRLLADLGLEMPPLPPLERRKFPREVFHVLTLTCDTLHRALAEAGVNTLVLREGFHGEEASDVFDMVALIVSELEYACSLRGISTTDLPPAEPPSPTLPAHTYRAARQLQGAIQALASAVHRRPDWLEAKRP